jgi:nitrogen fixation NifU-like protein
MAHKEATRPDAQPVTFFNDVDRRALEREVARRLTDRFSDTALRAALYPRHMGEMERPDGFAHVEGYCGDLITFYLRIADECISEITFTTDGCDATIASGEMLATLVMGKTLNEAERVTAEELLVALDGMPSNHTHCTELAVQTLREAIASHRRGSASETTI